MSTLISRHLCICHRCPRRQPHCAGPCACMVDGRDIISHASLGDCPIGRYTQRPAQAARQARLAAASHRMMAVGLGDVVARLAGRLGIRWLTIKLERLTGKPCGCRRRQEKLNRIFPYKAKISLKFTEQRQK